MPGAERAARAGPWSFVGLLGLLLLGGCALSPEANIESLARSSAFVAGDVRVGAFELRYYEKQSRQNSTVINVYLDGDGTPWLRPSRVARNPTPRLPMALHLMQRDPGAALYLGRPCYLGRHETPPCSPWYWTHGRYSETVVLTMASALDQLLRIQAPDASVRLIGHSGGGVLAALIAERLSGVVAVVTLGANLDVDVWADHHEYSRLTGSLNPAARPTLSAKICQTHFYGADDRRVPADLMIEAVSGRFHARFVVVPGFDHWCCWAKVWPTILDALDDAAVPCPSPIPTTATLRCAGSGADRPGAARPEGPRVSMRPSLGSGNDLQVCEFDE